MIVKIMKIPGIPQTVSEEFDLLDLRQSFIRIICIMLLLFIINKLLVQYYTRLVYIIDRIRFLVSKFYRKLPEFGIDSIDSHKPKLNSHNNDTRH